MKPLLLLTYAQLTLFHVSSAVTAEQIATPRPGPAVWNGSTMIPFPNETRALYSDVNNASSPFVDNPVTFSIPLNYGAWTAPVWDHNYYADSTELVVTFPMDTGAFIFYVRAGSHGSHPINITYNDGTKLMLIHDGKAATGFAVYGATSVTITGPEIGFAVGEFSMTITTPPPTTDPTKGPSIHPTTHPTDSSDELSSDASYELSPEYSSNSMENVNALFVDNPIVNSKYNKSNNNNSKSYIMSVNLSESTTMKILLVCGAIFIINITMYFLCEKKWKSKTTMVEQGVDGADNEV